MSETASTDQGSSTRPYLIRALHDWCTDNGFTPYLAVFVDRSVQVPLEYVKNNEIVLNIGFEATSGLKLGNEFIEFKARFGGRAREIVVPVDHVVAIYARENGQGMAFPAPTASADIAPVPPAEAGTPAAAPAQGLRLASTEAAEEPAAPAAPEGEASAPETPPEPPAPGRPSLKRIK
ncbi:ClpXP protease specificity-enhancing factor [Azohydromonas aeria]|uniref:ClpXP protease specificity-enhancing factor n=1 Tax=Azohydromonas aeria TaxID=2590212 RepID=UPI0012F966F5|nr:ClpXP protease specificity-enhancing factor [Azohydromonas aeria]